VGGSVELIPAIDLRGAKLVRLEQGDYERETVYDADPARVAASFVAAGAPRIHVVDLDGAREGRLRNEAAIQAILSAAGSVPLQLGGGIRSMERIEAVLALGVDRVILGTAALEEPDLVRASAQRFPGRIVLGLDAREGCLAIRGWQETAEVGVEEVLERFGDLPLAAVLHTDISRDGMLRGPNLAATSRLASLTQLPVIASGGVSSVEDLLELARTGVIAGAVVGRALYTGAIDLEDALRQLSLC
jgi:phosphoribosylformimino-5-aminoimidazole carboxamide ribotide isomerase